MRKITDDILLFENVLPIDLTSLLRIIRERHPEGRVELNSHQPALEHFMGFWDVIEKEVKDYYFQYLTDDNLQVNRSGLMEYTKFRWRELFLYRYTPESSTMEHKKLHWDFSEFTFVANFGEDDYEGGELYFPRQNIKHKLRKNDLIFFPGGMTHPHHIFPVSSGVRDVLIGQILPFKQDHWL